MNVDWLAKLGLDQLKLPPLKTGSHADPSSGLCAMEMVAFIERLPHSDRPPCTSPVVANIVITINDMLPDGARDRLLPWLPRVVGTVAPEFERVRAYAALEAVFDVVVGLHYPRILRRHMHDAVTGRRVAMPPWDYGPELAKRERLEVWPRHHAMAQDLIERHLSASLAETDPKEAVSHALSALWPLQQLANQGARWAREPVRPKIEDLEPLLVGSAPIEDTVTIRTIDYEPNWAELPFQILERVLAIGPKAKGWSQDPIGVMGAVREIAELA